jgi:hypothetical protein
MSNPPGIPSDDLPDVLAAGRAQVGTLVVSMSARHPEGRDAEYLEWHALDHEPEQHRLVPLRGSQRVVSTPACRAARAASVERYDGVDHVMTYLFAGEPDLAPFYALGAALHAGGRMPLRLPSVELLECRLDGAAAAPRTLAGADVIAWRPSRGVYLVLEEGRAPAGELAEVAGVAGVWWSTDGDGRQLTHCYLDDDPVDTALRLRPVLEKRWADGAAIPRLAAPFHTVVPYDWGRHLP